MSEAFGQVSTAGVRQPIWSVLGITREYWETALKNEHYFTESYLEHRAEVDSPKCEAALRKVWGDAFEGNARTTRRYLTALAPSFFSACDDEGHMFAFMPMFWEAALAAAKGDAA